MTERSQWVLDNIQDAMKHLRYEIDARGAPSVQAVYDRMLMKLCSIRDERKVDFDELVGLTVLDLHREETC